MNHVQRWSLMSSVALALAIATASTHPSVTAGRAPAAIIIDAARDAVASLRDTTAPHAAPSRTDAPEPAAVVLFASGVLAAWLTRRRGFASCR